jgi:hypothetical protein
VRRTVSRIVIGHHNACVICSRHSSKLRA